LNYFYCCMCTPRRLRELEGDLERPIASYLEDVDK
jgi:hypothetical protein